MKLTQYHKINFIYKRGDILTYQSIHKIFTNRIEKVLKIFLNFKKKIQNFEISP